MNIAFPYQFDSRGRTRDAGYNQHIRDLIEQLLFTSPGERVNRGDFGSNVLQLVFSPASDALATTTQSLIQGALQKYLGNVIEVGNVISEIDNEVIKIEISYRIIKTGQQETTIFERPV